MRPRLGLVIHARKMMDLRRKNKTSATRRKNVSFEVYHSRARRCICWAVDACLYRCCVLVPIVCLLLLLLRCCVVFRVLFFVSSCSVKLVSGAKQFQTIFFCSYMSLGCLHSCGSSSAIKPGKWWSGSGLFLSPSSSSPPRWQLFIVVLCRVRFSGSSFALMASEAESLEAN